MKKSDILNEIVRTATVNGGVPLGEARFVAETQITRAEWYGIHWAKWGDAVREAWPQPQMTPRRHELAARS